MSKKQQYAVIDVGVVSQFKEKFMFCFAFTFIFLLA